jgi:hypothetical protein
MISGSKRGRFEVVGRFSSSITLLVPRNHLSMTACLMENPNPKHMFRQPLSSAGSAPLLHETAKASSQPESQESRASVFFLCQSPNILVRILIAKHLAPNHIDESEADFSKAFRNSMNLTFASAEHSCHDKPAAGGHEP